MTLLAGCRPYGKEDAELYVRRRWWPGLTFGDLLDRAADMYPERLAVVDGQRRLTYSELRDTADRLAIALLNLGIEPLDRVLVQLPNWHEFAYIYFALQKIGAIPVILIDRYRQYEANHLCRIVQASAWIAPEAVWQDRLWAPLFMMCSRITLKPGMSLWFGPVKAAPYHRLEDLIAPVSRTKESIQRLEALRPDPAQIAHMGPTGGSTGIPKVAPRTHNDLICSTTYCAAAWELTRSRPNLAGKPHRSRPDVHQRFLGCHDYVRASSHARFNGTRAHLCYH